MSHISILVGKIHCQLEISGVNQGTKDVLQVAPETLY